MQRIASIEDRDRQYIALERADEITRLSLADLGYFGSALGMSDYPATFRSWLTSPEPVLLGCLDQGSLLGWCMFERWDRSDADNTPIHVLRMIEVGAIYRRQNVGRSLIALAAMMAPGHMVARPISVPSERFFQRLGFIRPPTEAQVDFHDKFGYVLLPSRAKDRLFQAPLDRGLIVLDDAITRCSNRLKTDVLRGELSNEPSFAQAFMSKIAGPTTATNGVVKALIKTDTSSVQCTCGSVDIAFYTLRSDERDELGVECARCGNVWLTVPV